MTRISIIMATVILGLACPGFADDKTECLNTCESDKRANSMYCPPAGGYTDNEHTQCMEKATADYKKCADACSPPSATTPPEETTPPAAPEENPVPGEQQSPPGDNPPPPE